MIELTFKPILMTRLKMVRDSLDISQRKLSDLSGIPVSHLNLMETAHLAVAYPKHLERLDTFLRGIEGLNWNGNPADLLEVVKVRLIEVE